MATVRVGAFRQSRKAAPNHKRTQPAADANEVIMNNSMTATLKPLAWTDPAPPNEHGCRYDHVTAETPLGQFSVEWKSWKAHDSRDLYLAGEHIKSCHDLDEAKTAAADHLASLVLACLEDSPLEQGAPVDVLAFSIQVEKLLCTALGREWSAAGISIVSLIDDLAQGTKSDPVTVSQALDAFEAAACKAQYDMRGGVKAVMELCAGRELSDPIPLASVPKHKFDCLVAHAKFQDATIAELRAHCHNLELYHNNEVWHWQHDGQDFLESLTCPVVIQPHHLRELIACAPEVRSALYRAELKKESESYNARLTELTEKFSAEFEIYKASFTYSSTQSTNCAGCGQHKHTPLRVDGMDGYVCLTCIDKRLEGLLTEESARHVEKDWDGCQEVADLPAVHEALGAFSADSTGDAGVAVVQAVIAALELRKATE